MGKIYIIGMGPCEISQMTLGCVECIQSGRPNYLRTKHHPTVKYFEEKNISFVSYDSWYEEAKDFNSLYEDISEDLISKAKREDINYFVPGNPMAGEKTVSILIEKYKDIEIISGLSFIEPIIEITKTDPFDGLKILNAETLNYRELDINSNIIITQVYNKRLLSDNKIIISEVYGDEYEIFLLHNAGIKESESIQRLKVFELDRGGEIGILSSIFIPKIEKNSKKRFDINDVLCIIEILRGINGCPWDRKQTHHSIRQHLIEEAYELAYAIDEDDIDAMMEELGDLFFQIGFHLSIAYEAGEFLPIDMTTHIAEKLIYRHPHVFGEKDYKSEKDLSRMWDELKYKKRGIESISDKLSDIKGLPALMTAKKLWEKLEKAGIDFSEIFPKFIEQAPLSEEEWGDWLLISVYKALREGVDSELALQKAIDRIIIKLQRQ